LICRFVQVIAHVKTLPFHEHKFNVLRGGIYMLVLWAALSSAVISATTSSDSLDGSSSTQSSQWTLIALAPVLIFVGAGLVERKREQALASIRNLRSELNRDENNSVQPFPNFLSRCTSTAVSNMRRYSLTTFLPRAGSNSSSASNLNQGQSTANRTNRSRRRNAYEEFFDATAR
jgi:hypothetical protein